MKQHRPCVGAESVIPTEIAPRQIMSMDVLTRHDSSLGEANGLAIPSDRRTVEDFYQRHLVSRRNGLGHDEAGRAVQQLVTRLDSPLEHGYLVVFAKNDGAIVKVSLGHVSRLIAAAERVKHRYNLLK